MAARFLHTPLRYHPIFGGLPRPPMLRMTPAAAAVGKSNWKFKISLLDGDHLCFCWVCVFLVPLVSTKKGESRVIKMNKTRLGARWLLKPFLKTCRKRSRIMNHFSNCFTIMKALFQKMTTMITAPYSITNIQQNVNRNVSKSDKNAVLSKKM